MTPIVCTLSRDTHTDGPRRPPPTTPHGGGWPRRPSRHCPARAACGGLPSLWGFTNRHDSGTLTVMAAVVRVSAQRSADSADHGFSGGADWNRVRETVLGENPRTRARSEP